MALTLALQRVYPCPFYLLDEIDSALDSVKVSNLANLLVRSASAPSAQDQRDCTTTGGLGALPSPGRARGGAAAAAGAAPAPASAPSQFIVLTHKAEMYEKAGLIVGVFQRDGADGHVDIQPVYLESAAASNTHTVTAR